MPDKRRLLELALKGLEADRVQLESEIAEIRGQLGYRSVVATAQVVGTGFSSARGKKRTMSASARRKISEAMKRRHALQRSTRQGRQPATQSRPSGLTPAGRRKLSEMMKARWAAKRKAGRKAA